MADWIPNRSLRTKRAIPPSLLLTCSRKQSTASTPKSFSSLLDFPIAQLAL